MDGSQKQSSQYGAVLDATQTITFVLNTHSFKCQHWWGGTSPEKMKNKYTAAEDHQICGHSLEIYDLMWKNCGLIILFFKVVIVLVSRQKKKLAIYLESNKNQ